MPKLIVFFEGKRKIYKLSQTVKIGRSDECDIAIKSNAISRVHAIINDGAIEDQGSKNGVLVNGEKITKKKLSDDDMITIGEAIIIFDSKDSLPIIDSRINLLLETILQSANATDLDDFLQVALGHIIKITGGDRGLVILKVNDEYEMRIAIDKNGLKLDKIEGFSQSIQRKVLVTGEPVFANNLDEQGATQSALKFQLRTIICTPVKAARTILGAIYVDSHSVTNPFTRSDLLLLEAVTNHIAIAIQNVRANERKEQEAQAISRENAILRNLLSKDLKIIGESDQMQSLYEIVKKVAPTPATILIEGESGTGKEKIARLVHQLSDRSNNAFTTIECAAIPETLLESELFGYEKGAFTGAVGQKIGRLEAANEGTMFLDEISELPLTMQAKLLRAIQELEIVRVGGVKPIKINTRVIAATNRDLENMVKEGKFRQDLYFRLNVIKIKLSPLKSRGKDILLLAEHFLKEFNKTYNKTIEGITEDAKEALLKYNWPGNIRELRHKIEQAVLLTDQEFLTTADLNLNSKPMISSLEEARDRFEKQHILAALTANNFNISRTAEGVGISRQHLQNLIKKHNIQR